MEILIWLENNPWIGYLAPWLLPLLTIPIAHILGELMRIIKK